MSGPLSIEVLQLLPCLPYSQFCRRHEHQGFANDDAFLYKLKNVASGAANKIEIRKAPVILNWRNPIHTPALLGDLAQLSS